MAIEIQGKNALVTGANRGIGKVIVESLVAAGAGKVYATARRPETLQPLVDAHAGKVVPLQLDLTDTLSVNAAAKQAEDVEIVINNGGVLKPGDPLSPELLDNIDFEFNVNVKGLVRVAQAFAPILKANGGGALVQLNSVASVRNFAAFTSYAASKAAAYSLTQGLHDFLAEQGTRVISVHPGPIETDMADQAGLDDADPPSVVADGIIDALKTGAYHVFPDAMAKQIWGAYQGFAQGVVEPAMAEA